MSLAVTKLVYGPLGNIPDTTVAYGFTKKEWNPGVQTALSWAGWRDKEGPTPAGLLMSMSVWLHLCVCLSAPLSVPV